MQVVLFWLLLGLLVLPAQAEADNVPVSFSEAAGSTARTKNRRRCDRLSLNVPETAKKHRKWQSPHLIVSHRGASAQVPEHTLAAYRLALELGADFVEPDLVPTQDGHLISLHTMDLEITTNVLQVFGRTQKQPWFSPFVNRSGYWTFNFTLQEIQQLRVNQWIPQARSTRYDGLFPIPTLTEILQLVNEWNAQHVPLLIQQKHRRHSGGNTTLTQQQQHLEDKLIASYQRSGIYAELKEIPWLRTEAQLDVVDLFFRHLQKHEKLWKDTLLRTEDCTSTAATTPKHEQQQQQSAAATVKNHDSYYKVPGLVSQSFDNQTILEFSKRWNNHTFHKDDIPEPPYVLLVTHPTCWKESFWESFAAIKRLSQTVSGIGCFKKCLILNETKAQYFLNKIETYNLTLHTYTERPEQEYALWKSKTTITTTSKNLIDVNNNNSIVNRNGNQRAAAALHINTAARDGLKSGGLLEELQFLFCERRVDGVFIESIPHAFVAARAGCPSESPAWLLTPNNNHLPLCNNNNGRYSVIHRLFLSVAFFLAGVVGTFLCLSWWRRRSQTTKRSKRRGSDKQQSHPPLLVASPLPSFSSSDIKEASLFSPFVRFGSLFGRVSAKKQL